MMTKSSFTIRLWSACFFDSQNDSVIYGLCAMQANRPQQHPSGIARSRIVAVVTTGDGRKWGIKKACNAGLFLRLWARHCESRQRCRLVHHAALASKNAGATSMESGRNAR
jgi:hypothetical protein